MPTNVRVTGLRGAGLRLDAIGDTRGFLNSFAIAIAEQARRKAPRKTGNLQRSIEVGRVTETRAYVDARAHYAAHVEFGTGLWGPKRRRYDIYPRRARALRFAASSGGQRLSGSARRGAAVVFARHVRHPGSRPQPYMIPAIRDVARKRGVSIRIIKTWNEAD